MASGSLNANTGTVSRLAGELDPSSISAAKAAAADVRGALQDCGDPLPGCQRFNADVRDALARFTAFFTEVERGIAAYASIARDSAADYVNRDGVGRAPLRQVVDGSSALAEARRGTHPGETE
ncbi:MAG TPA: hypothetical protein VK453_27540 [Micromonosporaceae bacterium]|nr:hypothetical protein [Micromonosporaceae bacterium]